MAAGDLTVYHDFILDLGNGLMDLENDTYFLGIVTASYTFSASASDPGFAGTAGTDVSASQIAATGGYTAGGNEATTPTFTQNATYQHKFDATDVSWTATAGSPTNGTQGILYNSAQADNDAVAHIDFGSAIDMINGDLNVNWHTSGILTIG